ncbi:MAG: glycerophosphodiester phosphodiesterase family protein [Bacteroidota bacterium]
MPENSIPAFLLATEIGVTTLELDLSVSKDRKLVVSHEPYFSPSFCLDSNGIQIPDDSIINIYSLVYDEIEKFDCGTKQNSRFPNQQSIKVSKPLLKDVIDTVENYTVENKLDPVFYNIELKTQLQTDDVFHPTPQIFSDLVFKAIEMKGIMKRVIIQSFDFRTLQYFNQKYPEIKLALLIENDLSWRSNIDSLGFTPDVYSCYYELLSRERIKEIQEAGMQVIPWTVNETSDMKELFEWKIDGIISDYPDRALELIK